jgi:DNA-binding transcriptional regulator YdaS (Cro superfamily)
MKNENESIGEWFEGTLNTLGVQKIDLARMLNTSPSTVSDWISNRSKPAAGNCDAIASSLDIDRNEVCRRAEHRTVRKAELGSRLTARCYPGLRSVVFVPIIGEVPVDATRFGAPIDQSYPLDPSEVAGNAHPATVIASDQ